MAGNGGGNGNGGGAGAGSGNGAGALGIPGLSFSTLSRVPTAPAPVQTPNRPSGIWGKIFDAAQALKDRAGQGSQPTARPTPQPAQYRTMPEATTGALGIPGLNFAPLSDAQYQAQYGHIGRTPSAPPPTATTPTGPIFRPASSLTPQERADVASNYRAQRRQERMFGGNR